MRPARLIASVERNPPMLRRAGWLSALAIVALAGCAAPPSLGVLGPYGATQVAPPGTGSYGRTAPAVSQPAGGNAYYSRQSASVASPTTSGLASAGPATVGDWRAATSTGLTGQASTTSSSASSQSQVIPTSAISPIDSTASAASNAQSAGDTVRIVEPAGLASTAQTTSGVTGGGMPVNDATRLKEPRLFSPPPGVIEISRWPAAVTNTALADAGNPAREMRGLSGSYQVAQVSAEQPVAATSSEESEPATTSATSASSTASASTTTSSATLGWRAKDGLK
jgi:hypothetical protein